MKDDKAVDVFLLLLILLQLEVVGKTKLYRMTEYFKLFILSKFLLGIGFLFLGQLQAEAYPHPLRQVWQPGLHRGGGEGRVRGVGVVRRMLCHRVFFAKRNHGKVLVIAFLFNSRLVFGCCLLPFCCRRCRVYKHRCPKCGAEMAKYAGALNSPIILLYFVWKKILYRRMLLRELLDLQHLLSVG